MGLCQYVMACLFVLMMIVGCHAEPTNEKDVSAINKLYLALGKPELYRWQDQGGDPCNDDWDGVGCQSNCITQLILGQKSLEAVLGDELFFLENLYILDLSDNLIGGPIPKMPFTLGKLLLNGNRLTGEIPDLDLPDLQYLDLADNNLSGPLPQSMEFMNYLEKFNIENNKITGTLSVLQNLPNLVSLNVENNSLSGPIPPRLKALPEFRGAGNPFDATIYPQPPFNPPSPESPIPGTPTPPSGPVSGSSHKLPALVITVIVVSAALLIAFLFLIWYYRNTIKDCHYCSSGENSKEKSTNKGDCSKDLAALENIGIEGRDGSSLEVPSFNLNVIAAATGSFSDANKLGSGGFGSVYKGTLPDGQQIAVKMLDRNSGQGFEEFATEINVIGKLQHRNLVRLLGYCSENNEKLLVYEYLANSSLDAFLFDSVKKKILNWATRAKIIIGIAKGVLYLHEDSRLKIIHRDLKASNVLLDEELNPKISDFGTARVFEGNQDEANTRMTVGTYGYLSPEYAMSGLFSVKSDVYSFGVLLLEILSGRNNRDFHKPDSSQNFLSFVKKLWIEKNEELIDEAMRAACPMNVAMRWIQIGLLCVEEDMNHRPTMSAVVVMLGREDVDIPQPAETPGISEGNRCLRFMEMITLPEEEFTDALVPECNVSSSEVKEEKGGGEGMDSEMPSGKYRK